MGEAGGCRDCSIEADAGAVDRDAVEGFRPPLVGGDAEAGDCGGAVRELVDLVMEGEEGDEGLGSGGDGEGGVAEGVGSVVRGFAGEFEMWVFCRCWC